MNLQNNIQIFDYIFDSKTINNLDVICRNIPIKSGNIANRNIAPYDEKGSHNLLGSCLFKKHSSYIYESCCPLLIMQCFDHIANNVLKKQFDLNEISLNVQTQSMDGTPHRDASDYTVIFFTSENWQKEWGGAFQALDENGNILAEVEYKPGRIIIFDSSVLHRGLSPTIPYTYRFSIAYRINNLQVNQI